jgi:gliding motility-associated-like protein/CSLREA domain-containing protein
MMMCSIAFAQAVWIVNTSADDIIGTCDATHCSLREALIASNANAPGPDSIIFNIPGPGQHTILLNTVLPAILDSHTIVNGTSQPGNNPMRGNIIIDGSNLVGVADHGMVIYRSHTKIYGLQIQNFPADGIQIFGGFGDAAQLSDIQFGESGNGNVIISNGGYGIEGPIDRDVILKSNYIGTDLAFTPGLGNGLDGVFFDVRSGQNVIIGGTGPDVNYFCSNEYSGLKVNIILGQPDWTGNMSIIGNRIGTDATGTIDLGNTGAVDGGGLRGGGILISGDGALTIGGGGDSANIIAFNYNGIYHDSFNQKKFNQNRWYCNTNGGIALANGANDGITTPNSICVSDGVVNGIADPNVRIDIFDIDTSLCPGGIPCQGNMLIGSTMSDAAGFWVFNGAGITLGSTISALAVDAVGNTSEFSNCSDYVKVEISNSGPYCPGDTIFLTATLSGNVANAVFEWQDPAGFVFSTEQSPWYLSDRDGQYELYVTFGNCEFPGRFTDVIINPVTTFEITDFCLGDSWVINGNTYDIDNTMGTEVLVGANRWGCDSIVEIDMEFNPSIEGKITTNKRFACEGDSVEVRIEAVPGTFGPYQVIYTDGTGTIDTLDNVFNGYVFKQEVTQDLFFEVLEINSFLTICEALIGPSDSVFVSRLNISPVISDYDSFGVSCKGAEDGVIILNAADAFGEITYEWSPVNLQGDIVTGLRSGTYKVTVTDESGCFVVYDTVLTEPIGIEPLLEIMDPSCRGAADGVVLIDTAYNVEGQLFWSADSVTFEPVTEYPLVIDTFTSGVKSIYFTDDGDCVVQVRLIMPRGQVPVVDAGGGKSMASGDSVLLGFDTDIDNPQILWSPPEFFDCPTCSNPMASPPFTQYVTVYLENDQGCSGRDSVLIQVFIPKRAYIPNVFSPNGDGINDFFTIYTNEFGEMIESIIVVNRGGVTVFGGNELNLSDPGDAWDGRFKGKLLNPGVFTYLVRIRYEDQQVIPFSGTVTLIR